MLLDNARKVGSDYNELIAAGEEMLLGNSRASDIDPDMLDKMKLGLLMKFDKGQRETAHQFFEYIRLYRRMNKKVFTDREQQCEVPTNEFEEELQKKQEQHEKEVKEREEKAIQLVQEFEEDTKKAKFKLFKKKEKMQKMKVELDEIRLLLLKSDKNLTAANAKSG